MLLCCQNWQIGYGSTATINGQPLYMGAVRLAFSGLGIQAAICIFAGFPGWLGDLVKFDFI